MFEDEEKLSGGTIDAVDAAVVAAAKAAAAEAASSSTGGVVGGELADGTRGGGIGTGKNDGGVLTPGIRGHMGLNRREDAAAAAAAKCAGVCLRRFSALTLAPASRSRQMRDEETPKSAA